MTTTFAVIVAAAVLHNTARKNGEMEFDPEEEGDEEDAGNACQSQPSVTALLARARKAKSCYNPLRLGTVIVLVSSGIQFVNTTGLYRDRATR